jgi:hypothetical protein
MIAACGGHPHPAPFDAKRLAADLNGVIADMATTAQRQQSDCPRLVDELEALQPRAHGIGDEIARAQKDPDHAQQLANAARAYDREATGRPELIAVALATCARDQVELRTRIRLLVDSLPAL